MSDWEAQGCSLSTRSHFFLTFLGRQFRWAWPPRSAASASAAFHQDFTLGNFSGASIISGTLVLDGHGRSGLQPVDETVLLGRWSASGTIRPPTACHSDGSAQSMHGTTKLYQGGTVGSRVATLAPSALLLPLQLSPDALRRPDATR